MSGAAKERAVAGPQTYVVQMRRVHGSDNCEWWDVATLTVPPRTTRRKVIERALAEADTEITLPATLRVLDATAAEEIPVAVKAREPELVIGRWRA